MRSYKTKAIIIKQYEVGEADRIIIAFSRDLGLITLSARGVRKILAKLKGHLELFNYSWLLIHKSSRGSIDTIIGAETIHSYKKLRTSLESTSRVYLIFEFLNRILPEREKHESIFKLLLYVLKEIENEKQRERRLIISSYFLLRAIKELGYAPHFRECIRCQLDLKKGGNYFDPEGGGIVCPNCSAVSDREFQARLRLISDKALIGLRLLNENSGVRLLKIKTEKKILEEMADLIESYVEYILETELKSKKFIKQVD
jgi:DNA repair protein RecO (recombination protein O)